MPRPKKQKQQNSIDKADNNAVHSDPNIIEIDKRKLVHLQNMYVDLQNVPISNEVYYVIKKYHEALRELLSLPTLQELVDKRILEHREIQGLLSPKYTCTCTNKPAKKLK